MKMQSSLLNTDNSWLSPACRRRYSTEAGASRAAAPGLEPSGQCSEPGSLNPGGALELGDMFKTK